MTVKLPNAYPILSWHPTRRGRGFSRSWGEFWKTRCHKILGPPLEWRPMGPPIINIMGPPSGFWSPLWTCAFGEAGNSVWYHYLSHAIMSGSAKHIVEGRRVEQCFYTRTQYYHRQARCVMRFRWRASWIIIDCKRFQHHPQLPYN